ncbi:phosphatase PAP2 family protein [Actinomycetes bacterium KLBMP 9797]
MIARPPLLIPLLALAGFLALLGVVATDWAPLERFDLAVSDALRRWGQEHPAVIDVTRVATDTAAGASMVGVGIALIVYFLATRQRAVVLFCVLAMVCVPAVRALLHWLLHHPRPLDPFVLVDSNSFPSGHSSNAATMAVGAILLFWPRLARLGRILLVTAAVLFAVAIGMTRLILLAHWPVDVLGAWLLALAALPLLAHAVTLPRPNPLHALSMIKASFK